MSRHRSRAGDCSRKRHTVKVSGSYRKAAILLAGATSAYLGHTSIRVYKQRNIFRQGGRTVQAVSRYDLLHQLKDEACKKTEELYANSSRSLNQNGELEFPCQNCEWKFPTKAEKLFHSLSEHRYREIARSPLELYLLPETQDHLGATLHLMYQEAERQGYQAAVADALNQPHKWYTWEWEMLVQKVQQKLRKGESAIYMQYHWKDNL